MIAPSSSEDDGDAEDYYPEPNPMHAGLCLPPGYVFDNQSLTPSRRTGHGPSSAVRERHSVAPSAGRLSLSVTDGPLLGGQRRSHRPSTVLRPASPSPSSHSIEKERETEPEDEEELRTKRLQLYVLVIRCIAYPFNAKQQTDMARRQLKVTKQMLQQVKERFSAFLKGDTSIAADEAFCNAVQHYYDVFLRSDRVIKMVQSGGCSASDFRDVFKSMIEKRVRSLPEIDGLSKETVLSSWMSKFDSLYRGDEDTTRKQRAAANAAASEVILSKEQLYDMFQNVLNVKKFEHQLLYNALQLDLADEQASQIRRELEARKQFCESLTKRSGLPKFLVKEMEGMYLEELSSQVNMLMGNLESLPVSKGSSDAKYSLQKLKRAQNASVSMMDSTDDQESSLSKSDIVLSFSLEVMVMEAQGLKLSPNKIVYCTMEVEGGEKLQTDQAEASKPCWDTQGDFTTTQPLPVVKIKLYTESTSIFSLEDTELGKLILRPTPTGTKTPEWHKTTSGKSNSEIKLKLSVKMEKPQNMKHCGYLYALGLQHYRKWKLRFMVLVQVSQYTFALCSYREKKADPSEIMSIDGYTVDFGEPQTGLVGGKFFFKAVREGDSLTLACNDENERILWVQALYRATGQTHKPVPPPSSKSGAPLSRTQGALDRASCQGMEEYISANPLHFDHLALFNTLQRLALDYRLNDSFSCLGWFSPGQTFVLDEYCARYGVRSCHRHLCYMADLLDRSEHGYMVDPKLLHYSFAFCASHVHGNKIGGVATVLQYEKERFDEVKSRLRDMLEHQITHFRYCFPFGRPQGALKATVTLLERFIAAEYSGISNFEQVLMKEISVPIPGDETRKTVKNCLEEAALVNYERISSYAQVEEIQYGEEASSKARLDNMMRLAELCVETMQQNEEYHAEAFALFADLLLEHNELFWSLFAVDMDACLESQPSDTWDSFPLFQVLNDYFRIHEQLRDGRFHEHLRDLFAPQVVRYVDLMEASIQQSIHRGFERERWEPHGNGCATSEDIFWKLDALQSFIRDLHWPDEDFSEHLNVRLKQVAADMMEACINRTLSCYEATLKKGHVFGRSTDYVIPGELCVMINVVLDAQDKVNRLCVLPDAADPYKYHSKVDQCIKSAIANMQTFLINRYVTVLEGVLTNLSRYDEGSITGSFFSFTRAITSKAVNAVNSQFSPLQQAKPGAELAITYVTFVRDNIETLHEKIPEEHFITTVCDNWYQSNVTMICEFLTDRISNKLQVYQTVCLITIVKKVYRTFQLHGVLPETLKSNTYENIKKRLHLEEASASISGATLTCGSIDELGMDEDGDIDG